MLETLLDVACDVMYCLLELLARGNFYYKFHGAFHFGEIDLFHPCHETPMSCLTFASSKGYMKVEEAHHL